MSKLGLHVISWNQSQAVLDFINRAKPRVIKVLDFNEMNLTAARASSPGTLFIGRLFVDSQPLDNPAANARDFFNKLQPAIQKAGNHIDVWEGYNEVVLNTVDDAKRYNDFTVAWAQLMHGQGLRCAAYSFSTGNPDYPYWQYLAGGARACDYLALHEYDHPRMDTHAGDLCLRYRKVRGLLPSDALRPILITECGLDDGNGHGWKSFASADSYLSQLAWYDSQLNQDPYVVGATIFTIDGEMWGTFDVLPIIKPLADYIIANPSPPPPPPPPPAGAALTAVSLSPTTLTSGQLLNVSITVSNRSSQTLQTQGPNSGFIYNEGDNFRTSGFPEVANAFRVGIDYDGRTGIDHPYRWGLGAPLAPGQSVTVTGAIRLNTPTTRNYWAGLVQENIVWLQDHQGAQSITINPVPPPVGGQPVISAVSFQPTSLNGGSQLNFSITVVNKSSTTLPTEGPNPGFVYNEGDTFYSRNFPDVNGAYRVGVDFDKRSGIDHPYRWGLGAPLAPGQSVVVTGGIVLLNKQAQNYWAGLVREQIAWLQDHQGLQMITVQGGTPGGGQAAITSASFSPTSLQKGQLLQVNVTITNGTNSTLPTHGPDPGFTYNDGDNFLTQGQPPIPGTYRIGVDFDNRTGVDHPYRWGFGPSLGPGQSATVTGVIRLNRAQVTNFWVGLIQEDSGPLQDQMGKTQITVARP